MFPDAKFVICHRKPEHMVNSIFCLGLQASSEFPFVKELGQICHYYKEVYLPMLEHWKKVLPEGALLEISTDKLVHDPSKDIVELLKFCQIKPSPECFSPHLHVLSSPTEVRVRKPISAASYERAEKFRPSWGELLEKLYPDDNRMGFRERALNWVRRRGWL